MGALIQTKGTQFLSSFFTSRFSGANLTTLRGMTDVVDTFGTNSGGTSLSDMTQAFQGMWTDGSDILFPSTTLNTVNAAATGTNKLTFSKNLPASVQAGMSIEDVASSAIPRNTKVQSVDSATQLTLTQPLQAALPANTQIVFSDKDHPNLWKRWKHYLKRDLAAENHTAIQTAIYDALLDPSYKGMTFQAVESLTQQVLHSTEFQVAGGKLDPSTKYKQLVLLTARTTAPDKIDRQ
jgi:hypothetical protein